MQPCSGHESFPAKPAAIPQPGLGTAALTLGSLSPPQGQLFRGSSLLFRRAPMPAASFPID